MALVKVGQCNQTLETDYADIRRELLRFRFDKDFHGNGNRVPLARFAELCSLSRQTIHNLSNETCTVGLLPETVRRIRSALELVLKRGVRWRRVGGHWHPYLPNGEPLPPQPQLPPLATGNPNPLPKNGHSHL